MRSPALRDPSPETSCRRRTSAAGRAGGTGLPTEVVDELVAAGLAIGEPMARDRPGHLAPRRALDPDGNDVVVQIVDVPQGAGGARTLRRLADLRSLRCDALVPVRQVVSLPGDRVGVVTDLIVGADLAVVLGARGGLTRSEAARLLDDMGGALAHLHEAGMAHGDVAAANVIISSSGQPILIDLLGGVLETGTESTAAPERRRGGPATPASDVYSLAALLRECAAGSPALAKRLERVLPDALDEAPERRPGARDLAARAFEIGQPGVIELPDGARLAAGALRAASARPTRAIASRRSRAAMRAARRPVERRRLFLPLVLVALITLAVVLGASTGVGEHLLGQLQSLSSRAPVDPSGSVPAVGTTPSVGAGGRGTDLLPVVVALSQARDSALNTGDSGALAATTVPGSPAAAADRMLLKRLAESGERIEDLDTMVASADGTGSLPQSASQWPGATAVRVRQSQGPSVRVGADGERRTVPAQAGREVVLVLVPDPWRVAEVLRAE